MTPEELEKEMLEAMIEHVLKDPFLVSSKEGSFMKILESKRTKGRGKNE